MHQGNNQMGSRVSSWLAGALVVQFMGAKASIWGITMQKRTPVRDLGSPFHSLVSQNSTYPVVTTMEKNQTCDLCEAGPGVGNEALAWDMGSTPSSATD